MTTAAELAATEQTPAERKGEGSIYQKSNGCWMYSIMHNGRRLTRSLKTTDEEQALKNVIKVRNNFAGRIDRGELESSTAANVILEELFDDYLKDMEQNGRKSLSMVRYVIGKLRTAPEFGNGEKATRKVASLETTDFKRYRARLVNAGATQATVNNHLAYVRAALKLESKQTPSRVRRIPHIPIVQVNNARQGFLEYDDHKSVLDALPRSLKALFVVAFHSGCRLGEVVNMRWSDVDWTNKVIRLPDTKNGHPRNLPFWGGIEAHVKKQKTYRDAEHPDCDSLFFWMAEDTQLAHGGVRNAPGTPVKDFRASWITAIEKAHRLNPNVREKLLFHNYDVRASV